MFRFDEKESVEKNSCCMWGVPDDPMTVFWGDEETVVSSHQILFNQQNRLSVAWFYFISILFHFRTAQRSFIRSCWTAGMLNGISDRSFQKLWRNSTSWFDLLINSTKILVQFPGKIACIDTIILPYSHFTVDSSLFHSYLLHFQWLKITQNGFNPLTPRGDKHLTSPYNIRTLSSKQVIRKLKLIG